MSMNIEYKNCQSCGMPLKKDKLGGGTNKNGSKSIRYCSHCYTKGGFVLPNISVQEMQERVDNKLKAYYLPSFLRWIFTKGIPNLERWKQ